MGTTTIPPQRRTVYECVRAFSTIPPPRKPLSQGKFTSPPHQPALRWPPFFALTSGTGQLPPPLLRYCRPPCVRFLHLATLRLPPPPELVGAAALRLPVGQQVVKLPQLPAGGKGQRKITVFEREKCNKSRRRMRATRATEGSVPAEGPHCVAVSLHTLAALLQLSARGGKWPFQQPLQPPEEATRQPHPPATHTYATPQRSQTPEVPQPFRPRTVLSPAALDRRTTLAPPSAAAVRNARMQRTQQLHSCPGRLVQHSHPTQTQPVNFWVHVNNELSLVLRPELALALRLPVRLRSPIVAVCKRRADWGKQYQRTADWHNNPLQITTPCACS